MTKEEFKEWCHDNHLHVTENCIKSHFPDIHTDIIAFTLFPAEFIFQQKLYHYLNDDPDLLLGLCPVCGSRCRFKTVARGYCHFCSRVCSSNSDEYREKCKETCLKKYGAEYASQTREFQNKVKQTCLKKYGKESYSQTDEYAELD